MRMVMRFTLVLCFVGAMAACPAAFAQGPSGNSPDLKSPGGPLAEVPEKLYDFGDLKEGGLYTHAFVIKNVGTAPLEIKKVIKI